jgi:hypothetical protein
MFYDIRVRIRSFLGKGKAKGVKVAATPSTKTATTPAKSGKQSSTVSDNKKSQGSSPPPAPPAKKAKTDLEMETVTPMPTKRVLEKDFLWGFATAA